MQVVAVALQLLSRVRLFVSPGTAAHQASLSLAISRSSPKFMFIESGGLIMWLVYNQNAEESGWEAMKSSSGICTLFFCNFLILYWGIDN